MEEEAIPGMRLAAPLATSPRADTVLSNSLMLARSCRLPLTTPPLNTSIEKLNTAVKPGWATVDSSFTGIVIVKCQ